MGDPESPPQFIPRFRNDVYPFIYPAKFRGSLQDKVALITGAAGAIGQGLAESFAVAGAKLVLTYNNTPPPPTLEERCLKFGASSVTYVKCNVASLEGCEDLVKKVCVWPTSNLYEAIADSEKSIDAHGTVDILINNAGANGLGPVRRSPLLMLARSAK